MKKRVKNFIISNYLIFLYIICVTIFELLGVYVTVDKFYIRDPRLFIIIIIQICILLYLIKNNYVRFYLIAGLLIFAGVLNLLFIIVYDMTGTFFDFGMINLRGDAMGIIESVPINFLFFSSFSIIFALFFVFGKKFIKKIPPHEYKHFSVTVKCFIIVVLAFFNISTVYSLNKVSGEDGYLSRLYAKTDNGYSELGITANFWNELIHGVLFRKVDLGSEDDINSFIYDEDSICTGFFDDGIDRSNYNVVTVLGETFEWFSFMQDLDNYPKGFNLEDPSILRTIYPNLYRFYDESLVMNNNYQREKTDISENLSIIGSYPTSAYINYDYPHNTIPQTVGNVLKILDSNILVNSYHDGTTTYYNRNVEHLSLGFEHFTACEEMNKLYGMPNYYDKGEKNLDSEMLEACKEVMFPTDRRFYTYITTITMHGQFSYRECLAEKGYYKILDDIGMTLRDGDTEEDNYANVFRYYAAAAIDFDRSIGIMLDYLESHNLLDKTIIVIFGDHNAYYQGLTNYVKQIYDPNDNNYTNLYRTPLMIRCPGISHRIINKFTCVADIVPTIFDLLGVNFYENLYFGNSIFSNEESIIYSRAYNVFITDQIYFTHLNNILYLKGYNSKEITESLPEVQDVKHRATILLKKLEYCDRIFYNDFFGIEEGGQKNNYNLFVEKMNKINN